MKRPPLLLRLTVATACLVLGRSDAPVSAGERAPYTETVGRLSFEMQPIPGGTFLQATDGSRPRIEIDPFWMSRYEITWDLYDAFRLSEAVVAPATVTEPLEGADAITRPTPPYGDESFGFGKRDQPVVSITHHAAMEFTRWLSAVTGKPYRLPTEAEWEYACRAGTRTPWSHGDDPGDLDAHGWYADNSDFRAQPVGTRAANPWGLFDMHGNVAEWVLDRFTEQPWASLEAGASDPVVPPGEERYPHVVRGGSWDDEAAELRCDARRASEPRWSKRDPQRPQSIWWHTDASFVGFRVVRGDGTDDLLQSLRSRVTEESP